jgi:hypothetical protein
MSGEGQKDTRRGSDERDCDGHLAALMQWAKWGAEHTRARPPQWSMAASLIEAARPWLAEQSRDFRDLLERSASSLNLADPLSCDLGAHRWLDKETAYSDWLAWVLANLGDARRVLGVLGIEDPRFLSTCSGQPYRVQREVQVKKGLPKRKGQIDLLIEFGEPTVALLGVEVKAWDEQYQKQRGYLDSLKELCSCVECVLIANATGASDEDLCGFRPREWRQVSIELRRAIASEPPDDDARQITRAMMLGFVAAIERNLVGLGTVAARRAWLRKPTPYPTELAKYLREALRGEP